MGRWRAALLSKRAIHSEELVIRGAWFGWDFLMLDGCFISWALIRIGIPMDRRAFLMNAA
jgi:hypothetical protein